MITYQDFMDSDDKMNFCVNAITEHKASKEYKIARDAEMYNRQMNTTINNFVKALYDLRGIKLTDFTATNQRIASNFVRILTKQRNDYLLGNGVYFDGKEGLLGNDFDTDIHALGYSALLDGVSFGYWADKLYCFPITEFVPIWDEDNGSLMAGIRFWQIDPDKPIFFVVYEIDGWTKYKIENENTTVIKDKTSYKIKVKTTKALGEEIVGGENYSSLPIIPLYGSELHQSVLVGMKEKVDAYDLAFSGFSNKVIDFVDHYMVVKNAGGMTDEELMRFRDRLKLIGMASVDTDSGTGLDNITQTIPSEATSVLLDRLRQRIYEDFGALDVSSISAAAKTATEINAAYQMLDSMADDYEYQIIQFIQQLLKLLGKEGTPTFKRNRVANQAEETQMILQAANYLDEQTVLEKLPFITVDEVQDILKRKDEESVEKFNKQQELMTDENSNDQNIGTKTVQE